jgi:cytochrome c
MSVIRRHTGWMISVRVRQNDANSRMTRQKRLVLALAASSAVFAAIGLAEAQLRGHGGPVRAVAVSADGKSAVSGGFDTSAIRWSLERDSAEQVLRFHDAAINAIVILKDGRIVTASQDTRVAMWRPGGDRPVTVFDGHKAPVSALAVSPDGTTLASASWDRTVRLSPLDGGAARALEGHQDNVNGVAFTPDGRAVVSAGYDMTLRICPLDGATPTVSTLPSALSSVAVAQDGEIIAGGANGRIYFVSPSGDLLEQVELGTVPLIVVAISGDGKLVATAGIQSSTWVIDRSTRKIVRTLTGRGLPVWSATFMPDNRTLLTGGADRMVRRWNALTGEEVGTFAATGIDDPLAAYAGDRGAEIFRACIACHTLTPDEGNHAGPTLAGIFGRRIATLSGYNFSPALKQLDIVWTPETVARLFEIGPAAYTPGTKMPEQRINSAEDREALVKFLEKAAKGR